MYGKAYLSYSTYSIKIGMLTTTDEIIYYKNR